MLAVPGCLEGLSRLLEQGAQQQLAQEAAWLLASAAAAAADSQLALISRASCFTQALAHLRSLRHHDVRLSAFLELRAVYASICDEGTVWKVVLLVHEQSCKNLVVNQQGQCPLGGGAGGGGAPLTAAASCVALRHALCVAIKKCCHQEVQHGVMGGALRDIGSACTTWLNII